MSNAVRSSLTGFFGGKNLPLTRCLPKVQQRAIGIQLLAVGRACQGDELDSIFEPLYADSFGALEPVLWTRRRSRRSRRRMRG